MLIPLIKHQRYAASLYSQRTGLLSMLDTEGSIHSTAESYVTKVKMQHKQNPRLFETRTVDCRSFGIQHFAGRVTYDTSDFLGMYNRMSLSHSHVWPYFHFQTVS